MLEGSRAFVSVGVRRHKPRLRYREMAVPPMQELLGPLLGALGTFACGVACASSSSRAAAPAAPASAAHNPDLTELEPEEAATRARWAAEQVKLLARLRTEDTPEVAALLASLAAADGKTWLVAGVDISFVKGNDVDAVASVVVVELPSLRRVCAVHEQIKLEEPYIPGFMAFREAPHYARLLERLAKEHPESTPVVVLVDGNGMLHPRGFGCASHFGVLAGIPTIGVAKELHLVDGMDKKEVRKLCTSGKLEHGQSLPLVGKSGRTWGAALRSSHAPKGAKGDALYAFNPIYVSIGHGISLASALALITVCCKHRIPEPVRLADLESRDEIRNLPDEAVCAPCNVGASSLRGSVRTGLVYDPKMMEHQDPTDNDRSQHPEQPARISRIFEYLCEKGLQQRCVTVPSRKATAAELQTVHEPAHVDTILKVEGMKYHDRNDLAGTYNSVFLNEGSTEASLLAAGSVTELVMRVVKGELNNGVAVVRPPGHHAECGCAMGFSLFGNVAVAARAARAAGVKRVLIVDWDVHHGNGTQRMFEDDPSVLYFSVHRHDKGRFYPGGDYGGVDSAGIGAGTGYSVNVPWDLKAARVGPGDAEFIACFTQILLPIATDFAPELVIVSAGFGAISRVES